MAYALSERSGEPSLQQILTKQVLHQAALKIAAIDANSGLVAECETLSAAINEHCPHIQATPLALVLADAIEARVEISNQPLSAVRAAIRAAGMHIYSEQPFERREYANDDVRIDLVGFDCQILATKVSDEATDDTELPAAPILRRHSDFSIRLVAAETPQRREAACVA